jgi:hypothetical protein
MPTPKTGESHDDFISRCIPIVLDEGTASNPEQAAAICNSMWEEKLSNYEIICKRLNLK